MTLKKKDMENTVGKGENAGNQHFLLFPQCFLLYQVEKSSFQQCLLRRLQMLSIWSRPKFCRLVKGFKEKINTRTDARTDTQTGARRTTGYDVSSLAYGLWS